MTKREDSVDDLAGKIRRRPYSIVSDNCLIKSVEFARRCTAMGLEAKVVPCLALFKLRVPIVGFRVTAIGPHFYTEVLGKRYEVSHDKSEKRNGPKVLVRLGRF